MTIAPIPTPESARAVIAALAGILRALMAALFGDGAGLPMRQDHRALHGCMLAGAVAFRLEAAAAPGESWIATPAPWRNALWAVPPRLRAHRAPSPRHAAPLATQVRAPPALPAPPHAWSPGSPCGD